jgi:hypothetical protein
MVELIGTLFIVAVLVGFGVWFRFRVIPVGCIDTEISDFEIEIEKKRIAETVIDVNELKIVGG